MKLIKVLMGKRFPDIVYDNLFSNCRHSDKSYIGYISRSKYTPEYIFMKIIDNYFTSEEVIKYLLYRHEKSPIIYENILIRIRGKRYAFLDKAYRGVPRSA